MFYSKIIFSLLLPIIFLKSVFAEPETQKDYIELTNGDILSGEIKNISGDGIVSFDAKNLTGDAKLNTSIIHAINLNSETVQLYGQNLFLLSNGDRIPGKLKKITDSHIHTLPVFYNEELVFPRNILSKILFGVIPKDSIYEGPSSSTDWDEFSRWRLHSRRMISSGKSIAARNVELPEQFSIEFDYAWRGNTRFKFFFADKTTDPKAKSDRYVLQITPPSNIRLFRQHKDKERSDITLKQTQFNLSNISDQSIQIKIKGDLRTGYLKFSINEHEEAPISDLIEDPSIFGKGVIFQHLSGTDTQSTIRNIKINHWNPQSESHLAESYQSSKDEAIVTIESDYFTGKIIDFSQEVDGQNKASIITNLSKVPLVIPENQISVISFPNMEKKEIVRKEKYKITVAQNGSFFADKLSIDDAIISCQHPILGDLKLDRNFVKSISVVHPQKVKDE